MIKLYAHTAFGRKLCFGRRKILFSAGLLPEKEFCIYSGQLEAALLPRLQVGSKAESTKSSSANRQSKYKSSIWEEVIPVSFIFLHCVQNHA